MKMSHVSHIICDFYVRHGAFSFGYCATNESGLARHTWKWVMTHFYPRMHLESWLIFMCVRHIPFVPRTFVRRTFECNMYKTGAPGTVPRTNLLCHERIYCATNESRVAWHAWKWVMSQYQVRQSCTCTCTCTCTRTVLSNKRLFVIFTREYHKEE